ncbi:MAG: hypothetical protein JXA45_00630 [Methanomassiliicoccales archaeon]|nr:hypothetical protein [Methanomassiliicoccales archaeon]
MAEAKSESLPFAAVALHNNALAAFNEAAMREGGAYYYGLQQAVLELGRHCLIPGSRVVALDCHIDLLMPLVLEHEDLCRFVVLSPEQERTWKCFDLLRTRVRLGFVDVACLDLEKDFPHLSGRMFLCLGAFDAMLPRRRKEVLGSIRRHLERGGVAMVGARVVHDPDHMGLEGAGNDHRNGDWSVGEWEACFQEAGFAKATRIYCDSDRIVWALER